MPAVSLSPVFRQKYFNTNGAPLAGGKVYTYQSGTTTPQLTYTDSTGATPNANPVILDANGEANIWFDITLSYKVILKDSSDVSQWTTDGMIGLLTNNSVGTASLQDGSVTTAKIADANITSAKLAASVLALLAPTGVISAYGGSSAPTGYLMCDGSAVSRSTYSALFAVIGSTYGAGNGTTTFNVPNTQAMFLRGAGSQTVSSIAYSATLGAAVVDTTKKNGLSLNDPAHTHNFNFFSGGIASQTLLGGTDGPTVKGTPNTSSATTGITINTGDSETKPVNLGVNYIIKT